ncbi:glycosyltransferase family 2 protein [Halioglobus maricola]|uniref:Glycosyltransferase family 2 protein n=1 Tax=Halioglobus maricola TaxID=2601894 RepID=A0A5P9NGV1_9GAMM|nr:glycosyltransferase family A protein [Halioglobus maricola]QFU74766.1 glycosyltransferase family 2 protein [Halioglobus maricola]
MKLSVILVAYDMAREIPRSLQSLARNFQLGSQDLDYEVLVVDNGSPTPLDPATFPDIGADVILEYVENASPSPASAINNAAQRARGDVICLMIDGAHMLTPGVFQLAMAADRAFDEAVVATRYFFMGPDEQNRSIARGYDKATEDTLLKDIKWPEDGYRLFEVGTPFRAGAKNITWFNKMFESNCIFLSRALFDKLGGCDEKFDLPGGGFLNLDLYKRAADAAGTTPVQLVGEGSFHQLHGGTTTNVSMDQRKAQTDKYRQQYLEIRNTDALMTDKNVHFLGHLPTQASKIHLKNDGGG